MASGEGTITYQWYSNDVQQNTGGTLINGATDPTFIPQVMLWGQSIIMPLAEAIVVLSQQQSRELLP
ncbi:hypothetical protein [Algoriphagus boritolerans]|uniref:hypothetical protein n=1 Tax=Algoriphagus boritolerans TaxID=308111 RepID=UPI000AFC6704